MCWCPWRIEWITEADPIDPIRSSDVHVCVMCLVSPPVGLIGGGWMGREGESCVCGLGLAVWCVS